MSGASLLSSSQGNLTGATASSLASAPGASLGTITDIRFENTNLATAQTKVPVTFGQIFAVGELRPGTALAGRLDDGKKLDLQVDVKAKHADGSVRHAIISALLPNLGAGEVRTMTMARAGTAQVSTEPRATALLEQRFSASVHATIDGVRYNASVNDLLKAGTYTTWLAGPTASEWQAFTPLKSGSGIVHPHLSARFAIRWYSAIKKARVDVTLENNWAYEPAPQNFTYDAEIVIGGKVAHAKPAMTHLHHARWRKVFWWGGAAPEVNIKHNTRYLIATGALPNFDQTLSVPETSLKALAEKWTGAITEPMAVGMANPYMPATGGRDDIGLLPGWAVQYLLSMDKRARDVTLGTADLAGSWSAHYRDRHTGQPISPLDYPYMTILGRASDTYNPLTKQYEAFPACAAANACTTPNKHDSSHQPGFAYLPYILTGDYYYLEELQFWAMWNAFSSNPGYRQYSKGLFQSDQVRAQAWSLRTLSEAAYITPDTDRLKTHFASMLSNNLDWYNSNYTNNPSANVLGLLANGYAFGYSNGTGIAPWQDDFFTAAVGHAAELGFAQAAPLLAWKTRFPILRMTGDGACWIDGAIYSMIVRPASTRPVFATIGEAYKASHTADFNALSCGGTGMAAALNLKVGEMTGYSGLATGYPSNMQPALAYGANVGGAAGANAWKVFMARSVKPNYSASPQFAIIPR